MKVIITNGIINDIKEDEIVIGALYGRNIYDISEYVVDSEADSIECGILDQIPLTRLGNVLTHYIKKLRLNGKITLIGTDIYLLAKSIQNRDLNLGQINVALFGGQEAHESKCGMVGVNDICSHLEENKLTITSKSFNGLKYKVEAIREYI